MPVAGRIAALIEALKGTCFEGMRPAQRRHLRDLCRYIADKADPDAPAPPKKDIADPNEALWTCSCQLDDGPIKLCPRHQEIVDGAVEVYRAALRPFERAYREAGSPSPAAVDGLMNILFSAEELAQVAELGELG